MVTSNLSCLNAWEKLQFIGSWLKFDLPPAFQLTISSSYLTNHVTNLLLLLDWFHLERHARWYTYKLMHFHDVASATIFTASAFTLTSVANFNEIASLFSSWFPAYTNSRSYQNCAPRWIHFSSIRCCHSPSAERVEWHTIIWLLQNTSLWKEMDGFHSFTFGHYWGAARAIRGKLHSTRLISIRLLTILVQLAWLTNMNKW